MRARTRFTVALGLVLATAGVSTAVAARDETSTDDRLRKAALAAISLSIVPPEEGVPSLDFPQDGTIFGVPVRNTGGTNVVLRRATWKGGKSRDINQLLAPSEPTVVMLPQPTTCPSRRSQEPIDHIDVEVGVAAGVRTVRLNLSDPLQPSRELNSRCGLFRARESVQAAFRSVRSRPHEVTIDVSFELSGPRATQLLAVRGTEGVTATVAEKLPLALASGPIAYNGSQEIPHAFTVTLRLTDCAGARSRQEPEDPGEGEYQRAPLFSELQLTVQHPGEAVEKVNVGFGAAPANALVAGCGLPPVEDVTYN